METTSHVHPHPRPSTGAHDVVVVGGGHAGIEAALAAARVGARVALVSLRLDRIGEMSCNPAIGGVGKGQIVREVDALGGAMGVVADATGIQFKLLNTGKGLAVQSPRCQSDRHRYRAADSIRWDALETQHGDAHPTPFSARTDRALFPVQRQIACHLTHTNERTHAIVRANIHRAPMYAGRIQGVGPRYCPSVEDKVMRFADKDRHLVFLEPESLDTDVVYVNGVSTSLPGEVQEEMLRTIDGLENARFLRHGYAVEYDFVAPSQLSDALAVKSVPGLFLAGQINGTSGYEEAAGQGLIAGANAALWVLGRDAFVLGRHEAYIGVMVDDLVVSNPTEPYRMFTSRAEHRLILRCDNAEERLVERARAVGLVGEDAVARLESRRAESSRVLAALTRIRREGKSLAEILLRPEVTWSSLCAEFPELVSAAFDPEVASAVAVGLKYRGYVERAAENVERLRSQDELEIPAELDYRLIRGLANEAREKLGRLRPRTLGAASRIAGVRPPDVALVAVHVERLRRERVAARSESL